MTVFLAVMAGTAALWAAVASIVAWGWRYRARWLEAQLDGFIRRETTDPTMPWPPAGTHLDVDGGVVWTARD